MDGKTEQEVDEGAAGTESSTGTKNEREVCRQGRKVIRVMRVIVMTQSKERKRGGVRKDGGEVLSTAKGEMYKGGRAEKGQTKSSEIGI